MGSLMDRPCFNNSLSAAAPGIEDEGDSGTMGERRMSRACKGCSMAGTILEGRMGDDDAASASVLSPEDACGCASLCSQ